VTVSLVGEEVALEWAEGRGGPNGGDVGAEGMGERTCSAVGLWARSRCFFGGRL